MCFHKDMFLYVFVFIYLHTYTHAPLIVIFIYIYISMVHPPPLPSIRKSALVPFHLHVETPLCDFSFLDTTSMDQRGNVTHDPVSACHFQHDTHQLNN